MSCCHQAIPPAPVSALARAAVRPCGNGGARSASSQRRPSARWPRCCQNRHSAPAASWARSTSPASMAHRRAARMLAWSRSHRSSHSPWSPAVRWSSASTASSRKWSPWRRRTPSASNRLARTPRPVPTARASRPSRAAPASSARATVTCSGSTSAASAGRVGCVCLGRWRSPSGRAAWSLPDTYHTAGLRRGPPPQVLRSPGQPPASTKCSPDRGTSSPTDPIHQLDQQTYESAAQRGRSGRGRS
jgi:hypothetical protein